MRPAFIRLSRRILPSCLAIASFAASSTQGLGAEPSSEVESESNVSPIAELTSHTGKVFILRGGERISAQKGMPLFASDQMMTGKNSVAKVVFADGSSFIVFQEGSVEIESYWTAAHGNKTTLNSVLNLVRGKARFFFKPREGGLDATVKSANAIMGVRGTLFFVDQSQEKNTSLVVLNGQVAVQNSARPKDEVLVRANETTVIAADKTPDKPAQIPVEVAKKLEAQLEVLPERSPDGVAPEKLSLPPPIVPGDFQGRRPEKTAPGKTAGTTTVLRQVITPQYMVVPLGSVLATKAGVACDRNSLDRLRRSAQSLDPETVIVGRELASCPVAGSEALFWLGFYHIARGEIGRAVEASRYAREEKIPLDIRTEREKIIQNTLEGNADELAKLVRSGNPLYAKDGEALLLLARTLARTGKFADARTIYDEYLKIPRLGTAVEVDIEKGAVLLLEGNFEQATAHFEQLAVTVENSGSKEEVSRLLALARARTTTPTGSEGHRLMARFHTRNSDDRQTRPAVTVSWDSSPWHLELTNGTLISESDPLGRFRRDIWEVGANRDWTLSSGTVLNSALGITKIGRQGDLNFAAGGRYLFDNGLGVSASFSRITAHSLNVALPLDSMSVPAIRLKGEVRYREIGPGLPQFQYTAANTSLDKVGWRCADQNLTARIPIHQGSRPGNYLLIRGVGRWKNCSTEQEAITAPKDELQAGAGFETGWRVARWLDLAGEGESALVFRKKQESLVKSQVTPSRQRQSIPQETQLESSLRAHLFPESEWEIQSSLHLTRAADPTGKKSWSDSRFELGASWYYERR